LKARDNQWQRRRVFHGPRQDADSVEIAAETDVIDAHDLHGMIDVIE
jgi:hypothetical protein